MLHIKLLCHWRFNIKKNEGFHRYGHSDLFRRKIGIHHVHGGHLCHATQTSRAIFRFPHHVSYTCNLALIGKAVLEKKVYGNKGSVYIWVIAILKFFTMWGGGGGGGGHGPFIQSFVRPLNGVY